VTSFELFFFSFQVAEKLRFGKSNMSSKCLSSSQAHALFDILTHVETYSEIENFKFPDTTSKYGFPFTTSSGDDDGPPTYSKESTSPLLQMLLTTFVLPLPGIRDLPPEFWSDRIQGLLTKFGEARLSESYDKGALGTRKTLATASSAIIEAVARGQLGGYPGAHGGQSSKKEYDSRNAADLNQAWDDVVRQLVYGSLLDDASAWMTENEDLEAHSPALKATIDFCIIQCANFLPFLLRGWC
jgi:hypothetical protein